MLSAEDRWENVLLLLLLLFLEDSNPLKCSDLSPNEISTVQAAFSTDRMQTPGSGYLIALIVIE